MSSSIFSSEAGKLLFRIVLPYLAIMAVFCYFFDGWFARTVIFSVEYEGPAKLHHFFETHDPEEVPIFGNSRTNHAIDPTFISPHSWNYGINGSDSELLRFLMEKELASGRRTPILIGIDPDFFFLNRFGDAMDYVPLSDNEEVWKFLKAQGKAEPYYRLPTLRFYGSFERFLHRYSVIRVGSSTPCIAHRGACLCDVTLSPHTPLPTIPKGNLPTKPTNYANARWLLETCAAHQERCFVFVELPFYYRLLLANNADAQFVLLRERLRALPNVIWVAATDAKPSIHYFENFTHLNKEGARWFSMEIRKAIDAAGACP